MLNNDDITYPRGKGSRALSVALDYPSNILAVSDVSHVGVAPFVLVPVLFFEVMISDLTQRDGIRRTAGDGWHSFECVAISF